MNTPGRWRWLIIFGLPILAGAGLVASGLVSPVFMGRTTLASVGGEARHMTIQADGRWPQEAVAKVQAAARSYINESLIKEKKKLEDVERLNAAQAAQFQMKMDRLAQQQKAVRSGPRRNSSRAQLAAKIDELKARRRLLIDRYPTHSDIPVLAKQIQELSRRLNGQTGPAIGKVFDLDQKINEAKVRRDYFARIVQATAAKRQALKPSWQLLPPIETPWWPSRVENWPWAAGAMAGSFVVAMFLLRKRKAAAVSVPADDLIKPEDVEEIAAEEAKSLEVIPSALPSDPLVEKSSALYMKWVELSRLLYTPAPEPPQGVLDQVAPLLDESTAFLPEGHEILAKYLAQSVTPGDLPSHVARTVLMTLTGAEEAKVSPEHRLAMGLAALLHDLAVVPRPPAKQDEVGSEVGRLSAAVLPRIPGLPDALLAMVDDILIGMDEYKMDTWQNAAVGKSLEPLSKVLREIDRFEKLMQRQKARLDRRVANQ